MIIFGETSWSCNDIFCTTVCIYSFLWVLLCVCYVKPMARQIHYQSQFTHKAIKSQSLLWENFWWRGFSASLVIFCYWRFNQASCAVRQIKFSLTCPLKKINLSQTSINWALFPTVYFGPKVSRITNCKLCVFFTHSEELPHCFGDSQFRNGVP